MFLIQLFSKGTIISEQRLLLQMCQKHRKLLKNRDQVHKFPHMGKFMHLIPQVFIPHLVHSLPVYTAPYIYIPGLSFNALSAEIRTRNHGMGKTLHLLSWGKFCTCSKNRKANDPTPHAALKFTIHVLNHSNKSTLCTMG